MVNTRHEASVIISKAQNEAVKAKEAIIQQVKEEQQKLMEQTKGQMEMEKSKTMLEAKSEIADIVTMATEKIIKAKMDGHKDQEMIKELLKTL